MHESKLIHRHDLLTPVRAAALAGVSPQTIVLRLQDGEIAGEVIGNRYFAVRRDVEAYALARATAAAQQLDAEIARIRAEIPAA